MRLLMLSVAAVVLVLNPSVAQSGSGGQGAYFSIKNPVLGFDAKADFGYPGIGPITVFLSISDGYGPTVHPVLGNVWLDLSSPAYQVIPYGSDANGNVNLQFGVPYLPPLFTAPSLFVNAFIAGPGVSGPGWSLSKTVRYAPEMPDGYNPVGSMSEARILHTVTSMAADSFSDETRVLIAGGSLGTTTVPLAVKQTTEIYNPLKRTFEPGPLMGLSRCGHRAVLLQDGKILVAGGSSIGGVVTSACELFDPQLNAFVPTNPMVSPRAGHAMTLLDDGRVLASGGFFSWINPGPNFANVLNTAQDTAEVYDPATGFWSPLSQVMGSKRAGHTQTLLRDGRVLIAGGVNGGQVTGTFPSTGQSPIYTGTAEVFDLATNALTATGTMAGAVLSFSFGRGFHGASLLANGDVLVTGGTAAQGSNGAAVAIATCERWSPVSGAWTTVAPLPLEVGFHLQLESNFNSEAIILGGFVGDLSTLDGAAAAYRHNGVFPVPTRDIGTHELLPANPAVPLGELKGCLLHNGTYLICGGADGFGISSSAWVIAEL